MVAGLRKLILCLVPLALAACATPQPPALGPDGQPLPTVYRISGRDEARIPFTMLDSVNALRAASGAQPLTLNAELTAAAATHSRDMSVQNRAWSFGSDGSSGLDRVARAGYRGGFVGEAVAETYSDELATLASWMESELTRPVILDPRAEEMGFAWFQERDGKLWWTLVTGARTPVTATALVN
jgi:uncharacterized protein YkwD